MSNNIFTGTIPALMTPCTAERKPDFDALVRKAKQLIETGMSAVVYCGSMGDWPLLTEAERQEGVARLVASPREATHLQPGEILVTRATDPGWTPVFSLIRSNAE